MRFLLVTSDPQVGHVAEDYATTAEALAAWENRLAQVSRLDQMHATLLTLPGRGRASVLVWSRVDYGTDTL